MNDKVYLLDRRNFEKESCHKYFDKEYKKLLKHELAHLYYEIFSKGDYRPRWLNDGLAVFLSEQLEGRKIEKFKHFLDYFEKGGEGLYTEGGFAVKILAENLGEEKLFELIRKLPPMKTKENFNLKFKEIYGKEPSYEFFNSLLNKSLND